MNDGDPSNGGPSAMNEPRRLGLHVEPAAQVALGDTLVVPVVEETARIEKRLVETGRVRVSTWTETIEDILRESLRSDHVGVTRVAIGRTLAEGEIPPVTRSEGGVTIVPVLEEILVVEKRLILKEEVHIRQTTAGEDVEVPVTLRRQHAVVERVGADGTTRGDPPGVGTDPIITPSKETAS